MSAMLARPRGTHPATVFGLLVLVLAAAGCGSQSQAVAPNVDPAQQMKDLDSKLANRQAALKAMTVPELAVELSNDSKAGAEPWNSLPYQEAARRGESVAKDLAATLEATDRSSFLGLLAVRAVSQPTYELLASSFRIEVLVSSLQTSRYFNAWGLPHLYWEEPAKAIIAEGERAIPSLMKLLSDAEPAPMWGEDEVVESATYKYRVEDYALALIRAIRGDTGALPVDPAERDKLIAQLLAGQ